ncbi:slipin family protein [Streptomyces albidoflavus]|uniref:slipin family protein n=1 Tax=Streptomyces albidoflavus TaxID=1886 RepID=UPI00188A36E9|nr:slipin family protein [Streptomyces albidoflavus]MBF4137298.1 slipin family protein [Streptomyces albidoflavus]
MIEVLVTAAVVVVFAAVLYVLAAARVVKQYERGVVFRLGRLLPEVRRPGLTLVVPIVDRLHKVSLQIVTLPIPAQEGITRDNVTVRVDAVVYFKVVNPSDALVRVEDYRFAVSQMAQTSLRSIIGKSELDDLLSNREKLNQGLELMIDNPAVEWGVTIDRVEIKDVSLPETMKRSMARQAEADRERRARVINADAELQASKKLAGAAQVMSEQPAALQLRLLQTVVAVAAEKNSTLVLPFPVELLRFLERAAPLPGAQEAGASPASSGQGATAATAASAGEAADPEALAAQARELAGEFPPGTSGDVVRQLLEGLGEKGVPGLVGERAVSEAEPGTPGTLAEAEGEGEGEGEERTDAEGADGAGEAPGEGGARG